MAEVLPLKGVPDVTLLIKFLDEQLNYTPVTFSAPLKTDIKVDSSRHHKAPFIKLDPNTPRNYALYVVGRIILYICAQHIRA